MFYHTNTVFGLVINTGGTKVYAYLSLFVLCVCVCVRVRERESETMSE